MEPLKGVVFHRSYFEASRDLPPEQKLALYDAIFSFAFYGVEAELSGLARALFTVIRPTLESSISNYQNGKKGGRGHSKDEKNKGGFCEKTKGGFEKSQTNKDKDKDKDKDKNKNIDIPATLNTPEFLSTWQDWQKHLSEKKAKTTPTAFQKQLKLLESWGVKKAIFALNKSINNNWQGVFEPNDYKPPVTATWTSEFDARPDPRATWKPEF